MTGSGRICCGWAQPSRWEGQGSAAPVSGGGQQGRTAGSSLSLHLALQQTAPSQGASFLLSGFTQTYACALLTPSAFLSRIRLTIHINQNDKQNNYFHRFLSFIKASMRKLN